ncbi:MAG: carboxypeptidase regulatory-like domain-containing protein, partial [Gemmatimonadota bacterium]
LGDGGAPIEQALTGEFGWITFRLGQPRQIQVRIERAGFVDTVLAARTVQGIDTLTVSVPVRRPDFPATLTAERACPSSPELAAPFGRPYAEVRKALRAIDIAERAGMLTLGVTSFVRALSPSLKLESEDLNTLLVPANGPTTAGSPEDLLAKGFLTRSDRGPELAAPTVRFFLTDGFLTRYCFGFTNGTEQHEGMLGLTFAPRPETPGGITGTMWLDPRNREPVAIDYRYPGLPSGWRPDRLGGTIELKWLNPGFWVTRFWYHRTPRLAAKEKLTGFREEGAEVTSVAPVVDPTDRAAAAAVVARQQQEVRKNFARISGRVTDTLGYIVPQAEVSILGLKIEDTTDAKGRFNLEGVPTGVQMVRVRKVGYKPVYFGIRLAANQEWEGKIGIPRLPPNMPDIYVEGKFGKPGRYAATRKYDDFYRRRAAHSGRFLTREDIDKSNAGHTQDLLRSIPGVHISFGTPGVSEEVSFTGCPASNVSVWVDGSKLTGLVQELLPLITPLDIEAVEVYPRQSLVPAEFRDNSCAALVFWTR